MSPTPKPPPQRRPLAYPQPAAPQGETKGQRWRRKSRTYVLRFFDRTSGSYAGAKKMAVSALRNETSAAIAKHIRDHPGVAQCDLATAFGVTPSTVTWHINRLAGQGLVQKAREAQHTRYYIGEAWAQLPLEEQARQAPVAAV